MRNNEFMSNFLFFFSETNENMQKWKMNIIC